MQSHYVLTHFLFFPCWDFLHRALVKDEPCFRWALIVLCNSGLEHTHFTLPNILNCSLLKTREVGPGASIRPFLVYWFYLLVKICFQLHLKHLVWTTLGKSEVLFFLPTSHMFWFIRDLQCSVHWYQMASDRTESWRKVQSNLKL